MSSIAATPVPTRRRKGSNWGLISMMIPGALALIVFSYIPMTGIIIAFKSINYSDGILGSPWIGLKNFFFLFKTPDAWTITRNTVLYNLAFIVLGTILSVAVAIAIDRMRARKMGRFYQAIMFLPYFFSWIVISSLVFSFLSVDLGFLNRSILPALGLGPVNWYTKVEVWPFILVFVNLWKCTGYNSVIYLASIAGIDPTYHEAAAIDGATAWQQIRHITLPLLMPVVIILTLLAVGRIFFGDFGLFYQVPMNMGPLFKATNVIDTYVYRTLMNMGDIGMSAAAGLYQSVVGFVLVLVSNLVVRRIDPDKSLFKEPRVVQRRSISQTIAHIIFIVACLACVLPLALVVGISFTEENTIARQGFNLIPKVFSLDTYKFVLKESRAIADAYVLTILVTAVGTVASTLVIALYAYPLSRKDFPLRGGFARLVFFTMLFSGGLVPWYMVCVNVLHLRNTFFALWLPYIMNAWYVMIMRTFYKENVPVSLIESAQLDGAGEYTIFFRIVVHLAKPGIATIALFSTITLWNDWWLPLMLSTDPQWFNLQYLMYRVQRNIQYLSSMASSMTGVSADILARLPSKTAQMAMCVLVIGPIVLAYPFFQPFFVKGITVGSIKE